MKNNYGRSIIIVTLLAALFPVGVFVMWKYSGWSKATKVGVSIIIPVLAIGLLLFVAFREDSAGNPNERIESVANNNNSERGGNKLSSSKDKKYSDFKIVHRREVSKITGGVEYYILVKPVDLQNSKFKRDIRKTIIRLAKKEDSNNFSARIYSNRAVLENQFGPSTPNPRDYMKGSDSEIAQRVEMVLSEDFDEYSSDSEALKYREAVTKFGKRQARLAKLSETAIIAVYTGGFNLTRIEPSRSSRAYSIMWFGAANNNPITSKYAGDEFWRPRTKEP